MIDHSGEYLIGVLPQAERVTLDNVEQTARSGKWRRCPPVDSPEDRACHGALNSRRPGTGPFNSLARAKRKHCLSFEWFVALEIAHRDARRSLQRGMGPSKHASPLPLI
eukprot:3230260-Amphidinium_carterae.1